jgi:hypothetical protein
MVVPDRDPALEAAIEKARNVPPLEPIDLENFCRLFEFGSKRDLEKYARDLIVHKPDFALFIMARSVAGEPFRHFRHHREFVPPHLHPTAKDRAAMATAKVGKMEPDVAKAFGKMTQIFKDRRLLSGHLFVDPHSPRWHFFYFDQRDLDVADPHWDRGAHIHFVNWLWPKRSARGIWEEFTSDKPMVKGALHLRYLDVHRELDEGRFRRPRQRR